VILTTLVIVVKIYNYIIFKYIFLCIIIIQEKKINEKARHKNIYEHSLVCACLPEITATRDRGRENGE